MKTLINRLVFNRGAILLVLNGCPRNDMSEVTARKVKACNSCEATVTFLQSSVSKRSVVSEKKYICSF